MLTLLIWWSLEEGKLVVEVIDPGGQGEKIARVRDTLPCLILLWKERIVHAVVGDPDRNEVPRKWEGLVFIMVTLLIVFRSSMTHDIQEVLSQCGIDAYTLIPNASGKGETGNVIGSFFYPGTNTIIFAMLRSDKLDPAISALKAYHATRVEAAHGQAIPLKLFSFPCDELI